MMTGQPERTGFSRVIHGLAAAILRTDGEQTRLRGDFHRLLGRAGTARAILDVGAADGLMTLEYARLLKVPEGGVFGIEVMDHYLERIAKGVKAQKLDIEKEPFPYQDGAFDVVVCNQVLEHLKNIFLPLSEMERVLKPGGRLALGIPNLAGLHNRVLLAFGSQPLCNAISGPHVRCFTHKGFLELLRSNGNFTVEAVAGSSLYPLPWPLVDFGARFFPGLSAYTFYLLRKTGTGSGGWSRKSIGDTCL
ncbi:MAG: class I SAM-dependent methyltransferase [Elusimicrobia bacterium]|nr:class I SAM-dependent methyltransferase [Elusimicrobiota bacterium]